MKTWCAYFATLGPIGYTSAPGTAATIVTLALLWIVPTMPMHVYAAVIILVSFFSYLIVSRALSAWRTKDPSEIVIDEVVGTLIACYAVPITLYALMSAGIIFRLLDIYKPGIIGRVEEYDGAYGIIMDDVLAGLITCGVMQIGMRLAWYW